MRVLTVLLLLTGCAAGPHGTTASQEVFCRNTWLSGGSESWQTEGYNQCLQNMGQFNSEAAIQGAYDTYNNRVIWDAINRPVYVYPVRY